jgi:hypothetical protein
MTGFVARTPLMAVPLASTPLTAATLPSTALHGKEERKESNESNET